MIPNCIKRLLFMDFYFTFIWRGRPSNGCSGELVWDLSRSTLHGAAFLNFEGLDIGRYLEEVV